VDERAAAPGDPPPRELTEPADLLAAQLDGYRATLLRKLDGLPEEALRGSVLPSGWSPLELVWHLLHVERRWLCWGFAAEPLTDPWADEGPDGAWRVPAGTATEEVLRRFHAQCARSRAVALGRPLTARAALGGRFTAAHEAPTLGWILLHLLQEYARHVGQLDVVRELADGTVGE
jgi:uncharacterized damage-inducible protein DinB